MLVNPRVETDGAEAGKGVRHPIERMAQGFKRAGDVRSMWDLLSSFVVMTSDRDN